MLNNSKQLQTFIKTHFHKYFKKNRFSETSALFLKHLFSRMEEGFKSFKTAEIKEESLDLTTTFPKGPDYSYISVEIRKKIENFPKIGKKFEMTIGLGPNKRTIRVYFILPFDSSLGEEPTPAFFKSCIKNIYSWFYTAGSFAKSSCSRDLDIYLYFTNHLKTLPKDKHHILSNEVKDQTIGQLHSNSAFTFSCNRTKDSHENDIYVYRFEEWFKVLIHESFHSLGLDFSNIPQTEVDSKILELYDVTSDPRFYETYTETWAEIINAMFFVLSTKNKRNENKSTNHKTYKRKATRKTQKKYSVTSSARVIQLASVLKMEQMFSLFQCTKVLRHIGLSYRELVSTEPSHSEKRHREYKEKTQVLAYYIMKSVFLWNVENFVEWCVIHNEGSLQFDTKNMLGLVTLLKQLYREPTYMETIKQIEKNFVKKATGSQNSFIRDTLRMTCIEV